MSDTPSFGFGNFLPNFDFLKTLSQGASNSAPQIPNMSSWLAPTVSVEDLEKRIAELKAVQFWLEQNSRALTATVQALEVQKMTLSTLKGMNVSMADMANAFTIKPSANEASAKPAAAAPAPAPAQSEQAAAGVVDPMLWWGALTQQFQQIAATAMTEATKTGATELAAEALKAATDMATKSVQTVQEVTLQATAPVKKAATRKAAPAPAAAASAQASEEPPRKAPTSRTKAAR